MIAAALVLLWAAQETIVIRTAESPSSVPAIEVPEGEIGVVLGQGSDFLAAAGFSPAPFVRGKVAFLADPKAPVPAGAEIAVWVTPLPRDEAAAILRESPKFRLCIVTGKGGGDPEPLKIGDSWMVQAPGSSGLWGRLEIRGTAVSHRFSPPDGKPSEKVAELRRKSSLPVDPVRDLRESAKLKAEAAPPALETANRACRLRIFSVAERTAYGVKVPAAGKRLLVLDAEFENIIPMTLVQSNQVPTIYKIKELGDHLYLVANGNRVSRLYSDATSLPGHVMTTGFTLDRLGTRVRGNLVYEIPAAGVDLLDLRFYDYAHGHMSVVLKPGAPREGKPLAPLQENDVLEAGVFRAERKAAAGGMTTLVVELGARSRMFTEGDATAFDPKAKPGDKLKIGTVSDWTDLRKHCHVLIDGTKSYAPLELEIGEAPRFIPDLLTGGTAVFLIPEKAQSLELRCDFPNARLPDGKVVHPKPLLFLIEGKRPEPPAVTPIVEIDDEIFKVAVTGQAVAPEFAGAKAPPGTSFLIVDIAVAGAGKAGEMFQTAEQLKYATEKGVQISLHEASYRGPNPPAKLHLVPTGERRTFQAVFAIPAADRKLRLAYRGVTKAATVDLKPVEGAPAAARACPKCKVAAAPNEKFCGECGTKIDQ